VKIIKISVISVLLVFNIGAKAQPAEQRPDPEWLRTYVSGDFCWAYDVQVDQAGNSYSTGYFQRNLKLAQGKYIEPKTTCYARCPDTWFLMKHDPNGNLLWVRYAEGNSRPARIAIDPNGFIWVAGNFYGGKVDFITADDRKLTLNGTEGLNSSLFIAHYNSNGELLHLIMPRIDFEVELFDFRGDMEGNFYLAGAKLFRTYDKTYEVKRTFALLSYDQEFHLRWSLLGDTVGQSHINAVCADNQGNVIATGGFHDDIRIGKSQFTTRDYNAMTFAFKANRKGDVEWAIDSLGIYTNGAGASMALNSKGDAFIVTTSSYSRTCLNRISSRGKPEWSVPINGKASVYHERLLLDKEERIWLAGEGYGFDVVSKNETITTLSSKGGTDPFMLHFSADGNLLQALSGGGAGTDYLKAIALKDDKLLAFGWFGGDMVFGDTVVKTRDGYIFWIGQFSTLPGAANPFPRQPVEPGANLSDTTWNSDLCTCTYHREKRTVFYPSLDALLEYDDFNEYSGWSQDPLLQNYKNLYYRDFQFSTSSHGGFYSLVLASFRNPVVFHHPSNTFGIDFTPCVNNLKIYELPITLSYEFPYARYFEDLENGFDRSAAAWFDFWQEVNQIGVEELAESMDLAPWLAAVAENDLEKLGTAMADDGYILDLEGLETYTVPEVNARMETGEIALLISSDILRQHDPVTGALLLNEEGKPARARILAKVEELTYSTESSLQATFGEICMPWAEIGTSGMQIQFNTASIVSTPEQLYYDPYSIDGPGFPERSQNGAYDEEELPEAAQNTPNVLDNFTGISVDDAVIHWPFAGKMLEGWGSGFLINNQMLCGLIMLPLSDNQPSDSDSSVVLLAGEEEVYTSLQDLQNWLKINGFDVARFHPLESELAIYIEMKSKY